VSGQNGVQFRDGLTRFIEDGHIELDDNAVERSIRPITLNRKNAPFSGHGFEVLTAISPWKQLIDVSVWMAVDDPGEHVGQVGKRINVVEFGAGDKSVDRSGTPAARIGAGKGPVSSSDGDSP
jgi:hypothetical protein